MGDRPAVMRSGDNSGCSEGAGLALLPCMLADPDPRLVRLTPEVLARRGLSLVYRREQRGNRPVRMVASFLIEALRSRTDRISGTAREPAVR